MERYDQLITHATGNIIWNNRFDLRFVGSSEGSAAFGFGAYFEQNPKVSEHYRRYGLPNYGLGVMNVTLKNGRTLQLHDIKDTWDAYGKGIAKPDIYNYILTEFTTFNGGNYVGKTNYSFKQAKQKLKETLENTLKHELGSVGRKYYKNLLAQLRQIKDVTFSNPLNGNIYQFDIPEDYELLDWDKPLSEQPEQVKKAIRKMISTLKRYTFYGSRAYDIDFNTYTGKDLYETIRYIFSTIPDLFGLKRKGITRADAKASWLFNRYGIPGHRYLDAYSRDAGEGYHNFVIWNMDRVKMVDIDPSSDELAQKIFHNGGKQQLSLFDDDGNPAETYQQIIGIKGAKAIDRRSGNTWLMDNLDIAIAMKNAGKSPSAVRLATGWELGYDNEWKYEIQDGNITLTRPLRMALRNNSGKLPYSLELKYLYNNQELFDAYPALKDLRVEFSDDLEQGILGFYQPDDDTSESYIAISADLTLPGIQSTLVHEIQHAVQNIEGFAEGGTGQNALISGEGAKAITQDTINYKLKDAGKMLIRAVELYKRGFTKSAERIADTLTKREKRLWDSIKPDIDYLRKGQARLYSTYHYLGGEIEARNVQAREHFTPEQRRRTLISDTQDENNWLITKNGAEQNFSVVEDFDTDNDNAASNNFLTPEKYNQLVYHGTDNIIRGNRFDLRFAGSSEGGAAFGYGAYFAENPATSESYRHEGDPNLGKFGISVTTKDGSHFSSNLRRGRTPMDYVLSELLMRFWDTKSEITPADVKAAKDDMLQSAQKLLKERKHTLADYKRNPQNYGRFFSEDAERETIKNLTEEIDALKSIADISLIPPKKGNVYLFDIPENNVLMDWDAHMTQQPDNVKAARKAIIQELKDAGIDTAKLKRAKTGEKFYRALSEALQGYSIDGITDSQQKASYMLNKHGVPGHRFLDSGSRDTGKGTHNFVIWNTKTITMLGVEGNPEAIEHFRNTALQKLTGNPNETYNQFIGEKGMDRLAIDGRFSALGTADTLENAKQLDAKHMPVSFIWKSTGWIKGKDGEWRTEIPDGKLSDAFTNNPKRRNVTLKDVYDNDILYSAYPDLVSMKITIKPMKGSTRAYYSPSTKSITINQNSIKKGELSEVRLDIIHEIQHAIQDIEGFATGSSPDKKEETKLRRKINKLLKHPNKDINKQLWVVDLTWAFIDKNNPEDVALLNKRVAGLTPEARAVWQEIQELRSMLPDAQRQDLEKYKRSAGEVEARNSETRADFDTDRRRNTPPTLSEDTPRSKQILNRYGNNSSFLTPEKYDQLMHHGSKNILLSNRFDLRWLNTGEGSQFYGYGIYLGEAFDIGEYYRKAGMSEEEIEHRKGNHYLVDGPENDILLDWDAKLSEQPEKVLDILKNSGLLEEVYNDEYLEDSGYFLNTTSGETFYKDLASYLKEELRRRHRDNEDRYILASMKLNEAGIPGLRYFDALSRDKKSGTHNFVIWNTDTLRLLGLTDDSDNDAQDYYRAEDYSRAYLDSLDNDSDIIDYSDRDYDYDMAHIDDLAEAHSDALDNSPETFYQQVRLWQDTVDAVLRNDINPDAFLKVINPPDVLRLIGLNPKPLYMNAAKILRIRADHKTIFRDILGQIPYAISDPVAIFNDNRDRHRNIMIMTDIIDMYGNSVVVPVNLAYPAGKRIVTRLATVYSVGRHNRLAKLFEQGNILYLNRQKAAEWENRTGRKLPLDNINAPFNENDLAAFTPQNEKRRPYRKFPSVIQINARQNNNSTVEAYSQSANDNLMDSNIVRSAEDFLTPEARQQVDALRRKYQGTSMWLKAPNGNDTKLSELQWLLVRTDNFKAWFGDWEYDQNNASKVIDKNGEPLVVYHGSEREDLSIFDTKGKNHSKGAGSFFSDSKDVAETFVSGKLSEDKIFPVFLNIRNPYIIGGSNNFWSTIYEYHVYDNIRKRNIFLKNNGSNFQSKDDTEQYISNVLNDPEHKRYTVKESYCMTTDDIARFAWSFRKGNKKRFDGVIIRNVYDIGYPNINGINPISDEFIIPKPNQIKSATRNNGQYSTHNQEIYKQSIGEYGAKAIDNANGNSALMDNLRMAQEMHRRGIKPRTIKRSTGWELGIEGKWKYELQDGQLRNPDAKAFLPLREFYDNEPLFLAYPKLNDINVAFDMDYDLLTPAVFSPMHIGHYDRKNSTIHLQSMFKRYFSYLPNLPKNDYRHEEARNIKAWLVSQIQRIIQPVEGFAVSRSQRWFDKRRAVQKVDGDGRYYPAIAPTFPAAAHELTAGETEAANAGRRAEFTQAQRRNSLLTDTEDVPRDKQLIIQNGKKKRDFDAWADDYANARLDASDIDSETYNQSAIDSDFTDSVSDIPREQITAVRKKYKGTSMWMKAPNGKPTNLTPKQWLQVRTPNFKAWFGDWENDPYNSSQVVDENGEPLVLYHRTQRGNNFSVFRKNSGGIHFGTRRQADDRAKGRLFPVFLNVRNPFRMYDQGAHWNFSNNWTEKTGNDGIVYLNEVEGIEPGTPPQDSWIVFEPNQIKSATKNNGYFDANNPDIYKQTATINNNSLDSNNTVRSVYDFLTPEAQRQAANIKEKYQNTTNWMKAPNGKKSNLNELQWLLVRTDNFKRWFGDWENNPQGASKVLDANGEPLLVTHQTGGGGFSKFNTTGKFSIYSYKTRGTGAWFADLKDNEPLYSNDKEGENIYHVFLNIRNPFIYDAEGRHWEDIGRIWIADEEGGEPIYYDNDGKPFLYDYQAREYIRTVLRSNPRYYYEHDNRYPTTDDLVRAVRKGRLGNGNHDGVIIRNVGDLGYDNIDDYVIFKPIQVKARDNNGAFSLKNNEIYKQAIGEIGAQAIDRANGNTNLMDNLKRAKSMAKSGKSPKEIKIATGWELGTYDKKWRYEIPDGDLRPDGKFHWYEKESEKIGSVTFPKISYWEAKLQDIFDAPELYLAYPQLKNLSVPAANKNGVARYQTLNGEAWIDINPRYVGENGSIVISPTDNTGYTLHNLRSTILHEIQHAIQDIEGFAAGSNSKKFKREFDDTKDQRTKIKEDLERRISEIEEISGYNEFCRNTDWSNIDFFEGAEMGRRFWANSPYGNEYKSLQAQWRRVTQDSPEHKYLRTPGEREARNIETRQNFSDQQRRNTLLSETEDDNGRFRDENGQFYDEIENETYYQTAQNSQSLDNNPLIETFSQLDTFSNPDTENAYRLSYSPNKRHESGIMRSIRKLLRGFKGDFPLLAGIKRFIYAREILRRMNRNLSAKANITAASLHKHLHGLNAEQFNIFARLMLLNDIYAFSKANKNDNIGLPLGYTQATLRANRDKFVALARKDKKVMDAILAVYNDNKKIRQKLIDVVSKFGFTTLAERLQADDLFLVQYANLLAGDDINPNYIKAIGYMRISVLQDLERLYALYKLNERYGKKATLIQEYGKDWRLHIPKGYKLFFPLSGRFLSNAHSLTDEITGEALDDLYQELGLSENARRVMHSKLDKPYETRTLVLPAEIVQTLEQMSNPVQRSAFAELMIRLTSIWKKSALYLLPRAFKYNARNVTGDLDAAIAGAPTMIKFIPQSFGELMTAYYGDLTKVSSELKEFQARGGALTFQSAQMLADYKEFKAFNDLIDEMQGKDAFAWKNLPRQAWNLIDKFVWTGIQKTSDFREQWLRYVVYLDYLDQMRKNNGIPNNWGASVKKEVLALDDIRDRAFKMANELLGAYDQVSETGKQLREILFPFYSWIEVNGKRYWQLIKNGFTQEQFGDFAARFLKGHLANLPYYSYKIGKTLLFINLFGWLVELFNHLFFPDDEEKLPPEIQGTLHITLGHDENGNVRYFSQIGALSDVLDWFDLDMPRYDIQRILNGQMTVSEWLNRMISAPFNKTLNAVTPFIKTTMEMVSGRSLFPEPLNPRPINNRLQTLAQSFGLNWPYKWATGENINHWEELKQLFIYKENAQQAAYFYIRYRVRQYQERVLGQKPFGGSGGGNERTPILAELKRAIRNKDKEAIMSNLDRFYSMKGNDKGLKSSLNSLDPLSGIAKNRRNKFKAWLPERDRAFFNRAEEYYSEFMSFYSTAKAEYDRKKEKTRTQRRY